MNHHSEYPSMSKIKALAWENGQPRNFIVLGWTAKILLGLVDSGNHGITARQIEACEFQLGFNIRQLRQDYGLDIVTLEKEFLEGETARYVLQTPVEIIGGFFE